MNRTVLVLSCLVLYRTAAAAGATTASVAEPTKAETVEFIESKLARIVTSDDYVTEYSFGFGDCYLVIKGEHILTLKPATQAEDALSTTRARLRCPWVFWTQVGSTRKGMKYI
jgi:hypothetical protein